MVSWYEEGKKKRGRDSVEEEGRRSTYFISTAGLSAKANRPLFSRHPVTPSPRHLVTLGHSVTLDHSVTPVSCRLVPAAPQPRRGPGGEKEVRSGALRRTGGCVKERQRGSKLPSSQPRTREQTDRPREGGCERV